MWLNFSPNLKQILIGLGFGASIILIFKHLCKDNQISAWKGPNMYISLISPWLCIFPYSAYHSPLKHAQNQENIMQRVNTSIEDQGKYLKLRCKFCIWYLGVIMPVLYEVE